MGFSYSFHLSGKSHRITDINKAQQCSRHNLRAYESEEYDESLIHILRGSSESILEDIKKIYEIEFSEALREYNEGRRADRKISDYLNHVSNSRTDIAAEIIIQVGDRDFWQDKYMKERKIMGNIFQEQINHLEKVCPDFVIASAVIHYDESSPHMHVIGVPVAGNYQKGMRKQVAKTKVFTKERLSYLQDTMREHVEKCLVCYPEVFKDVTLKSKEEGRNKDIPKQSLNDFYALQRTVNDLKMQAENQAKDNEIAEKNFLYISKRVEESTPPVIQKKEEIIKDGLLRSHKEYSLWIPAGSEKEAEELSEEIQALYTKEFCKEALKDAAADIQKEARSEAEKMLKDAVKQIEEAKRIKKKEQSILEEARKKAERIIEDAKDQFLKLKEMIQKLFTQKSVIENETEKLKERQKELKEEILKIEKERENLEPLKKEIDDMKYRHDILSGQLRYEYAKTHFVSTREMSFMRSSNILNEGNVVALYKDGKIREVQKGKNSRWDEQTQKDYERNLCEIGVFEEERSIKVPESIFKEMLSKIGRKPWSKELRNLVRQEEEIERGEMEVDFER